MSGRGAGGACAVFQSLSWLNDRLGVEILERPAHLTEMRGTHSKPV